MSVEYARRVEAHLGTQTFKTLIRRISRAGFAPDFVRTALLPDWWGRDCEKDAALVRDVTFRIARFLDAPLSSIEGGEQLAVPTYPGAQLRHVKNIDADALGPAIHAALRIAAAVVRSLREAGPARSPPTDAAEWASQLTSAGQVVDLPTVVSDLWSRGIPVVHVELLPAPKFQGLACVVEGRPVIVLGHANDEPVRLLVHAAHEAGHVVHGDCEPGAPVIDEEDDVPDTSGIERTAEHFAWSVLGAGRRIPELRGDDFRALASAASSLEDETHVDAGVMLWSHANKTQSFRDVQMALKALYRHRGGRRTLRDLFDRFVDIEAASETDRALLRCVFLDPERDERSV